MNTKTQPYGSYDRLLTEEETINLLSLNNRPDPKGALRWLTRTKQLGYVNLGRGIRRFTPSDVNAFIQKKYVPAK